MGSCRRIANDFRIVGFNLAAVHMPRRSLFLFLFVCLSFHHLPFFQTPYISHLFPFLIILPRCHRDSMIQRGDQLLESSQEIGSPNFRKLPVQMLLTFLHTFLPNDSWVWVSVSEISKSMSQFFVQIRGSITTFSWDRSHVFIFYSIRHGVLHINFPFPVYTSSLKHMRTQAHDHTWLNNQTTIDLLCVTMLFDAALMSIL